MNLSKKKKIGEATKSWALDARLQNGESPIRQDLELKAHTD